MRIRDVVFVLDGNQLRDLPSRTMQEGLFGKTLEESLQTLLERYPEILPGYQIDPNAEDPPRFFTLGREVRVGDGYVDLLFVDQSRILTFIEVKLIQNPQSRREVVGQILEYAANARVLWDAETVKENAIEYWNKRGRNFEEVFREFIGVDTDPEDFWEEVATNLKNGRIRIIVVSDEIHPNVRRILEYLNMEMENTEILGLEIHCYGDEESMIVLLPRIVGQTQMAVDRKLRGQRVWKAETLHEEYLKVENPNLRSRLLQILNWALEKKIFLSGIAKYPSMGLRGKNGNRLVAFFHDGTIFVYLNEQSFISTEERDDFVNGLKKLGLLDPSLDPEAVSSGRNLLKRLHEIDDAQLSELLSFFERHTGSLQS